MKSRVLADWSQGYDFVNAKGERLSGQTRKMLVAAVDGDTIVRTDIVKAAQGVVSPVGSPAVTLLYDKFGRVIGWQEDES